jgi:transposase
LALAQRGFTLAELNAWLEGIEIPAREPHHAVAVTRVS